MSEERTPRQEVRVARGGWLVMEGGVGVSAPTRTEAHERLDHILAMIADDRLLSAVAAHFYREDRA